MNKIKQDTKLRFKVLINMIFVCGLMLIYTTPLLQASLPIFMPLGLTLLWMLHIVILTGNLGVFFNKRSKWWIILYVLGFMMIFLGLSNVAINFQIVALPKYVIPIMGYFIIKYYNNKELSWLLVFFIFVFVGNLVWNIIINIQYPEIFENLSSSDESREIATMMNLADTAHNALCLWGIGTLWICLENTCILLNKLLQFAILLLLLYFMLMVSTRGTTILLFGVLVVGIYLARKEPDTSIAYRNNYYKFWIIVLLLLLLCIITPLLIFIIEHIESKRLTERLNDVMILIKSGNLNDLPEGSMAQRIALSRLSLNTFFASPINMLIGIGEQAYVTGDDLYKLGIGQHSEFIDVLARNGLLGFFIYYKILGMYINTLHSLSNNRNIIKFVDVLLFVFIIYGFLNLVFQPLMLIYMFIVLPSCIILLKIHSNG